MLRLFSILLLGTLTLTASDYVWPLKAKPYLSATFCEYRDGHFHAGIDVKTWGEMGVPCQAITDGYIERISAGYWGYGKVLFLKLDDGRRAVYAHLEHFTPVLEKQLRAEQKKSQRYATDIKFPENHLRVNQGEILAWSGVSGTRFPHLHFEVRDSANIPINPMQFYSQIRDTQAPFINFLAFVPLGEHSRINGSKLPYFINIPEPGKKRNYVVQESIHTADPYGIEFNSFDVSNGTLNKYAIYKARFFLDDSLVIEMTYDQLPFETADLVSSHRPLYADLTNWRFTRLYQNGIEPGLDFFLPGENGYLRTPPGDYRWKLVLEDYNGNQTTVQGTTNNQEAIPAIWSAEKVNETLYRFTRNGKMARPVQIDFQNNPGEPLLPKTIYYNTKRTTWEFELPEGIDSGIQAISRGEGVPTERVQLLQPKNQLPPALQYNWAATPYGKLLKLVTTTPWYFPPYIDLVGYTDTLRIPLNTVSDTHAESHAISAEDALKYHQFSLRVTPDKTRVYDLQKWQALLSGDSLDVELMEGALVVRLQAARSNIISRIFFEVDTLAMEIDGAVWPGFRITLPNGDDSVYADTRFYVGAGKVDVWHLYKRKGHRLIKIRTDTNGPWLEGELPGAGEYLLLVDTTSPELTAISSGTKYRPGDKLLFKITDNLPERTATVRIDEATLNNEKIFPDYNPLRQEISYWLLPETQAGSYRLEITLSDQAGNRSVNRYSFSVQ
ncbi:MAG: M23 family metallopeptidase [Lentisphaeria bacterium]|nr:M23 family metallopeptidase [Candidatus Neomarinimicrobiota bacterium]MCF7841640.1 M23 family metallopeptidase [Lentisphaeria bacterium]